MSRILLSLLFVSALLALSSGVPAQEEVQNKLVIASAGEADLASYLWSKRVLVVFADTPADPRILMQIQMIEERPRDLTERDVVVLTDTDPAARSGVRAALRPRGFALVLVDKDGGVTLRKPSPWQPRDIARAIDKTPLRLDEIRERAGPGG